MNYKMDMFFALLWIVFINLASQFLFTITRIQSACLNIFLGFLCSHFFNLQAEGWVLTASIGATIITFLAGNEFDRDYLASNINRLFPFATIGFTVPFLIFTPLFHYGLDWSVKKSVMAALVLSETSIAMVYSVIAHQNYGDVGKFVFCSLHLTDLMVLISITVLLMETPTTTDVIYAVGLNIIPYLIIRHLKISQKSETFLNKYGGTFFLLCILSTALSAKFIHTIPAAPVFCLGFFSSSLLKKYPQTKIDIKNFGYMFLIPFYFIRAGSLVSLDALISSVGIIIMLFVIKYIVKGVPLFLMSRRYGYSLKESAFISSLMSTGLTFGTYIIIFSYDHKLLSQNEYSILLCTIILTAVLPTIVAEYFLHPQEKTAQKP